MLSTWQQVSSCSSLASHEPETGAYVTEGSLVEGVLDGELGRVVATLRGSLASAAGNSVEDRLT